MNGTNSSAKHYDKVVIAPALPDITICAVIPVSAATEANESGSAA
jgi:hypothetical protein